MFLDKIYNVLLTQSGKSVDKNDNAIFINQVLTWLKIRNVKTLQFDDLHSVPEQAEIRSTNNSQLDFIIDFGQIALNMAGSQGNRIKQLSKDTATTIHYTCNGNVSRHLLASSHIYVPLGQITTDRLEKVFRKLR